MIRTRGRRAKQRLISSAGLALGRPKVRNSVKIIGALSEHTSHCKDDDISRTGTLGAVQSPVAKRQNSNARRCVRARARLKCRHARCAKGLSAQGFGAARVVAWRRAAGSMDAAARRRNPRAARSCLIAGRNGRRRSRALRALPDPPASAEVAYGPVRPLLCAARHCQDDAGPCGLGAS